MSRRRIIQVAVTCVTILVVGQRDGPARPHYLRVYKQVIPSGDGSESTKCAESHVGDKKTMRNDFGTAFEDALGAKNVKDDQIIEYALKKAAKKDLRKNQ